MSAHPEESARIFLEFSRRKLLDEYWPRTCTCLDSLTDEQIWWRPNEQSNSIGNLLLHLNGNLRQWIVAPLGKVANLRDRPAEFAERHHIESGPMRENLARTLEEIGQILNNLIARNLTETYTIQGYERTTALEAIYHAVEHFGMHHGQILYIAKLLSGSDLGFYRHLDIKIVSAEGFSVIGIAARTSNAREMTGDGAIPKLWRELVREGVLTRLTNRADSNIIALYTDYESDEKGLYTFVLGAKVPSIETIPQGMVAKQVPAGQYAVFTSERGPVAEVVVNAWKRIWSLPQTNPAISRSFKADFEIYDERATDPQNAEVEIHVGIK